MQIIKSQIPRRVALISWIVGNLPCVCTFVEKRDSLVNKRELGHEWRGEDECSNERAR